MIPTLPTPGVIIPGQFGPIIRTLKSLEYAFNLTISNAGIPSVITIINSIKSTMDSLGEILYGQIPYKEWKEFTPTVKPVWQNLQFFYLFTVAICQADYFDKLGKKEERDRVQANVLKYIPIINNHFSDNLFDNSKYSTKTFRETENTIKQLISETEEKIEKLLKDSLKQVSLLV